MGADMPASKARVLVIGLDSMPPSLLFERFLPLLPNVQKLLQRSTYGTLRSTDPPITVPAWAVMFSGMDPGTLGLYGFRHRKPGTYWENYLPTSRTPLEPMVWDRLSREGKRVCVVGMPPGYPPPSVNGVFVSDFLTPPGASNFVFPSSLQAEVDRVVPGYQFDVAFRAEDRTRIGEELLRMTHQHFALARHLWAREPWDFFALHEIGPDRLHHTFWKYFDPGHPRYEENATFREMVENYYRALDREIGEWLALVAPDVRVLLLSDHGSQAMAGGFCVNEWLIRRGYLTLRGPRPPAGTPIESTDVDWSRTRVWGAGGYYARIFFNLRGREREGIVPAESVASLEADLRRDLASLRRPDGYPLQVEVRRPQEIYRTVRGDAPDLIVYFGDVAWRSVGSLGHDTLFVAENDTGPDDAVHSFDGIYSISTVRSGAGARGPTERIIDIAPTVLSLLGVVIPESMQGRVIERFR
jgi:predicted AlkP superfamily phosphohydrolase/phosphomutase